MSNERTGAILHIGGTIPRRLVVALCAEISAATVCCRSFKNVGF